MKMLNRIKDYFTKAEEVEVPQYVFSEYYRKPFDVVIKDKAVGVIRFHGEGDGWVFKDTTSYPYTSKDLLKISFKLNSLNI